MPEPIDFSRIRNGDRRMLAKGITLLESTRQDHRPAAHALLVQAMPHAGKALRLGISGASGAGKSTMIEALGQEILNRHLRLAVLAVDPSSSISGGAILGDKTRMPTLAAEAGAFIRPSPAGDTLGGVARRTRDAVTLCEAAGYDVIIVETVGVGQSETLVSRMTDVFLLLVLPGAGDQLQGIKRGIMELADIIVVNKADGDMIARANAAASDIQQALRLMKPGHAKWRVPTITASALAGENLVRIWESICSFYQLLREDESLTGKRSEQAVSWFWEEARANLLEKLSGNQAHADILRAVRNHSIPSSVAAQQFAASLLDGKPNLTDD